MLFTWLMGQSLLKLHPSLHSPAPQICPKGQLLSEWQPGRHTFSSQNSPAGGWRGSGVYYKRSIRITWTQYIIRTSRQPRKEIIKIKYVNTPNQATRVKFVYQTIFKNYTLLLKNFNSTVLVFQFLKMAKCFNFNLKKFLSSKSNIMVPGAGAETKKWSWSILQSKLKYKT